MKTFETVSTCESINDIFGENAELNISNNEMNGPEIVSHIRNRLPYADDTCPAAFIQAAAMLFLLHSKEKWAVEFMDIPEYMFSYDREYGYRIVHETWNMLRAVLPSAETRGISVVADAADAFGGYFESKETMDKLFMFLKDVRTSVREVLDDESVMPDMFLLLAVLSFILDYGYDEDSKDEVYRYAYDGLFECMRHTPDTDNGELMDVIRVAVSILGRIRRKIGIVCADSPLLAKCSHLFRCIAEYEFQRTLDENGCDLSDDLEDVFGEGAVIGEEEDDDSDEFDFDLEDNDDDDYDKDYVSGCIPIDHPQTRHYEPEVCDNDEPEIALDLDDYFADEE